mmetsp:Transcript_69568/g.185538  ORF Transcript_69568/g.185538 Transcript_69568/m.185538 type:complete len:242 (+) Transcript_69568:4434-5159(+)
MAYGARDRCRSGRLPLSGQHHLLRRHQLHAVSHCQQLVGRGGAPNQPLLGHHAPGTHRGPHVGPGAATALWCWLLAAGTIREGPRPPRPHFRPATVQGQRSRSHSGAGGGEQRRRRGRRPGDVARGGDGRAAHRPAIGRAVLRVRRAGLRAAGGGLVRGTGHVPGGAVDLIARGELYCFRPRLGFTFLWGPSLARVFGPCRGFGARPCPTVWSRPTPARRALHLPLLSISIGSPRLALFLC